MPDPSPQPSLPAIVRAVAADLTPDRLGTGPLAALRRLDPEKPPTQPALLRLLVRHVPDLPAAGAELARWALLVHAMALAAPGLLTFDQEAKLGAALFIAGYSEGRFTRLLEARAEKLPVQVPRMVRFLVARGQPLDPVALAWFIFGVAAGGERADAQRTRLAMDYYRAERWAAKTNASSPSASTATPGRAE